MRGEPEGLEKIERTTLKKEKGQCIVHFQVEKVPTDQSGENVQADCVRVKGLIRRYMNGTDFLLLHNFR